MAYKKRDKNKGDNTASNSFISVNDDDDEDDGVEDDSSSLFSLSC
jgi:hypothetical protein